MSVFSALQKPAVIPAQAGIQGRLAQCAVLGPPFPVFVGVTINASKNNDIFPDGHLVSLIMGQYAFACRPGVRFAP
ncbi:MAG: hypothetical protein FD153_1247 [Rhodospirillaceae bacterium]|nr:MAG: hypothetical protein FD153_1247 [Rhodospirillaceae bacterium]